ncbi:hypothetical protein HOY80DRAFT_979775 [Tuber brumale]|nr:hypothetical protein HOY80DRAFT_979775 [Tuber brumale]
MFRVVTFLFRLLLFSVFPCEVGMDFSLGPNVRLGPYRRVLGIWSGRVEGGMGILYAIALKSMPEGKEVMKRMARTPQRVGVLDRKVVMVASGVESFPNR